MLHQLGKAGALTAVTICLVTPTEAEKVEMGVQLGQTMTEDIICDLGPPLRRFWKEDVSLQGAISPNGN